MEAVRPANVKRAVTELRDNMLARSTRGPYESRLRAWNRLALEGKVLPPGAGDWGAFLAGAYRSAKGISWRPSYQEHDLRVEVDPLLRRFANRVIKAIVRGLPGSRLKEAFPLPALAPLVDYSDRAAFDPNRAAHSTDVFVVAVWFMLREIEVAAARVGDMVVSPGIVVLDLPLHKTAQGGERTLTRVRLRRRETPVVPGARGHETHDSAGGSWPPRLAWTAVPRRGGGHSVQGRLAEAAAGLETVYRDSAGVERQTFGGHACRVAGATFLAFRGIPMAVIQLLGRWSSRPIERYTQSARLTRVSRAQGRGTVGCPGTGTGTGVGRRKRARRRCMG